MSDTGRAGPPRTNGPDGSADPRRPASATGHIRRLRQASATYQMRTRSAGSNHSASVEAVPNASWNSAMLRTT